MITAVVKNRRGDVVRGPFRFTSEAAFEEFRAKVDMGRDRFTEHVEEVHSSLSFEEGVLLDALQGIALNANGYLKHFHMDADFHRRLKNRQLQPQEIQLLADTLAEAAAAYKELASKDQQGVAGQVKAVG